MEDLQVNHMPITSHELIFELLIFFFSPFLVWNLYSHKQNDQGPGLSRFCQALGISAALSN